MFHPLVSGWFQERFRAPTEPQAEGWPAIRAGDDTLIAAPTGSGKTLTAFLACIDDLLRQAVGGELAEGIQVVYVSPLKALSNDIRRNLEQPLVELGTFAARHGFSMPPLRAALRTGDSTQAERQAIVRRPPQILVTTPESLYLMLTSPKSRERLRSVRTVIVDEIHALARDKRGSHLALTLARLDALTDVRPQRIGLSATQRPLSEIAKFLVGADRLAADGSPRCRVVDVGHLRTMDLGLELPASPLSAVCSNEQWAEVYERLCELIGSHRSTLVFVNTRRLAERVSHHLRERLGEEAVASHHGSLSKEIRLAAEERLKTGQLKAIVATASLELGIDVGYIDLVCQIGSPRNIATFLQRVGRSGHALGLVPKGRLFPLTRDALLESMAILRAVRQQRLDAIRQPEAPIDILAQQIVATAAGEEWEEGRLYALCRSTWPYRNLERGEFDRVIGMLSEGYIAGRRQQAYLHRDRIRGVVRGRRAARLAAITSGGAIPDPAEYRVVTAEERTFVGTLNEDFAIESLAGDVFQLGDTSWRVQHVRGGEVVVTDAHGAPATVPFWLGEAPGRTAELSAEVSEVRRELAQRSGAYRADAEVPASQDGALQARLEATRLWAKEEFGISREAAAQAVDYVAAQQAATGVVPTVDRVVYERFFDEAGGMQLVIHAPFGAEVNRAWGLAMRKRFCRSFNFELQASADDNGVVLSLGPQHSFPLEDMFRMLNQRNARELLVQAMLAAPMFGIRWRWNATRALAVLRFRNGKKVPPHMQRFRSDDMLSAVFPMSTACLENVVGDIELPDHPLVNQTVQDCLHEAMDFDRFHEVLGRMASGEIEIVGRDTREPSPFTHEMINANAYSFLDDAPLEERRARAVATRRSLSLDEIGDLAWLDPQAVALVRRDAWPMARDADELLDALLGFYVLPAEDGAAWDEAFESLRAGGRAVEIEALPGRRFWVATERWAWAAALWSDAKLPNGTKLPEALLAAQSGEDAARAAVRARLEVAGPTTAAIVAEQLGMGVDRVLLALAALENEGTVLRGNFLPELQEADAAKNSQWCDRRLLARIHRLTLEGARRQVQPVEPAVFWRFAARWQHVAPGTQTTGRRGLSAVLSQLQGWEMAAGAWEQDALPMRLSDYDAAWLDDLMLSGDAGWGRLQPPRKREDDVPSSAGLTRTVPLSLFFRRDLAWLLPSQRPSEPPPVRASAEQVLTALNTHGALFHEDLAAAACLLPSQVDEALAELSALGLVAADGLAPVRRLAGSRAAGGRTQSRRRRQQPRAGVRSGRWSKFPPFAAPVSRDVRLERWARQLLARWGVVFRDLAVREPVCPSWGELVGVFRRLEARGQVRGGRFISGVSGEQFADPIAVDQLRRLRDDPPEVEPVVVSGADPLNLSGVLPCAVRVPAVRSAALAIVGGTPVAAQVAGEITFLADLTLPRREELSRALVQDGLARAQSRDAAALARHSGDAPPSELQQTLAFVQPPPLRKARAPRRWGIS